jgi:hypothetical protein
MIPVGSWIRESGWMRNGIEVRLGPGDRERLEAVIGSGNSPQKHVWRARIVLLSADGVGTMAIQRQTGKGKPIRSGAGRRASWPRGLPGCCMRPPARLENGLGEIKPTRNDGHGSASPCSCLRRTHAPASGCRTGGSMPSNGRSSARYMSLETTAPLTDAPIVTLPTVAA